MQDIQTDFELSDYEMKKIQTIDKMDKNYLHKVFSSFLDYNEKYVKFFEKSNCKDLLDKYIIGEFNLARFLWKKIHEFYFNVDSHNLIGNLTKLVPYLEPSNSIFNSKLTHSFYIFSNIEDLLKKEEKEEKHSAKKKKSDYKLLKCLIDYDKLQPDDKKYIELVMIPIICRGDTMMLKLLHDKNIVRLDRNCIQKCLYYGRYQVLEFFFLNYREQLLPLIDDNILEPHYHDVVTDIWGGMYWANDECDKPILNEDHIDHEKTFNILKVHSVMLDLNPKTFLYWYQYYVNDNSYSIDLYDLLSVFSLSFEKSREGIKNIYKYTGDKNISMKIVNELFTKEEIFDLLV
jgi:hypothetical protein